MSARNEVTGREYQGRNVMRLLDAELEHDYADARGWAGFQQWLTVGRVVRKGEHGTACLTVMGDRKSDEGSRDGEQTTGRKGRGVRGFRVFHYDQTEPLDAPKGTVPRSLPAPARIDVSPIVDDVEVPTVDVVAPWGETYAVPAETDAVDVDNSADAVAARRAMFSRLGWSVTQ